LNNGLFTSEIHAFTSKYDTLSGVLMSKVIVFTLEEPLLDTNDSKEVLAIEREPNLDGLWDTGAACSVVTQRVVAELNLKPIKYGTVSTPNGEYETPFFYVRIGLPNHVMVGPLLVPLGQPSGCDVLIGMDVIANGDFAVSNYNGKTTFSFRIPSIESTDYVKNANISKTIGQVHGKGKKKKKR